MREVQLKHIDEWTEEQLIQECLKSNEKAQRYLFEIHKDRMFAVCKRYLTSEDESFDVLNAAFLKVFNKINQLEKGHKLEAWMRKIVVNTALDYIRKNKRYRVTFIRTPRFKTHESSGDSSDDLSEWWLDALQIPQERLFIEINQLPKASGLVFNLFVLDGLQHKEIGEQLNISESTSRWHLSNARKILKEKVKTIINTEIINERRQHQKY